ncbi:MAG: hypothetical protein WCW04_01405 [Candidatus Paceibacterota bacterium]
MSKELKKTTEEIMSKIHKGQIKMRPRLYFVFGYIFAIIGLVFSFITSIFFVGLTRFTLRSHGPMGEYRLEQLLSTFSWWMPVLAIIGLITGIWLLRKYDFSYKINFKLLIIGLVASILIAGFVIDMTGLNDFWLHRSQGQGQGYRQGQFRSLNSFPVFNRLN